MSAQGPIAAIVLAFYCTLALAEDPKPLDVLTEAQELARAGKYEEALQKHLWYHDNALRIDRGQGGVRLSFALSYWLELGKKYPKAMDALLKIRDKKTKELELGVGSFDHFHEVFAINRYLEQNEKTRELFKFLDKHHPAVAMLCFHVAKNLLAESHDYELCGKYIKDPMDEFRRIKEMRTLDLNMKFGGDADEQHKIYTENRFIQETSALIEILSGAGRDVEATRVKEQALAVVDNAQIREAIDKAIARAKPKAS